MGTAPRWFVFKPKGQGMGLWQIYLPRAVPDTPGKWLVTASWSGRKGHTWGVWGSVSAHFRPPGLSSTSMLQVGLQYPFGV